MRRAMAIVKRASRYALSGFNVKVALSRPMAPPKANSP